jgi:hypothetical protein
MKDKEALSRETPFYLLFQTLKEWEHYPGTWVINENSTEMNSFQNKL